MAFSVSTLTQYVNEHKSELLSAAVLSAKTTKLFNLMPEVKGPTTLNLVSTPVTFQSGANCGFSASGDVTFTQRTLTPGVLKVNEEFCPKALRQYYMQNEVKLGAGRDVMPFEEQIMASIIANIGAELEKALWQGDSTNGSGNLALFNGLATIVNADCTAVSPATPVISTNNQFTAASGDTIWDRVKTLVQAVPDSLGNKMSFYMSSANFRKLCMLAMEKNLYHYERDINNDNLEMIFPGSDIKVIGVPGMAGLNRIYGFNPEEVYYGFDMEDDNENFKLWFSDDNDTFRFKCQFVAGMQYAFPQDVLVGIPYGGGN